MARSTLNANAGNLFVGVSSLDGNQEGVGHLLINGGDRMASTGDLSVTRPLARPPAAAR